MTTGRNKAKELSNKGTNKILLECERRAFHFANEASLFMNNIRYSYIELLVFLNTGYH